MDEQTIETASILVYPEEQIQLIHFCARITNNRDVAEDLVQDTLLEAWHNIHLLRDEKKRKAWLFGIARNMCLRWLRDQKHDRTHLIQVHPDQESFQTEIEDILADELDIELELERKELIELLDRALSLLPTLTRTALIQHYVDASPLTEIAARLHSNASAVSMRLQRGKLVLRHTLAKEIGQDTPLFAAHASEAEWEITPLWCHGCGKRKLLGKRDAREGKLLLKCPNCNPGPDETFNNNSLPVLKGVKGYKPLYSRLAAWCDRYYHTGLRAGSIACEICGSTIPASITTPEQFPRWLRDKREIQQWMQNPVDRLVAIPCEHCFSSCITTLESLVLESAQGQQFLQRHPRIRTLPRQYLETGGRPAVLTRFESVTSTARLDIISDDETYEVLHVYGESQ